MIAREQHIGNGAALPFARSREVVILKQAGFEAFIAPDSSLPITEGMSRTQALSTARTAISPPESI